MTSISVALSDCIGVQRVIRGCIDESVLSSASASSVSRMRGMTPRTTFVIHTLSASATAPLCQLFEIFSFYEGHFSIPLPFCEHVPVVNDDKTVRAGDGGGGDGRLVQNISSHLRVGTETPAGTARGSLGGRRREPSVGSQPPAIAAAREDHGMVIVDHSSAF